MLGVSLNNMGELLRERGELADAEPYLREALALKVELFGAISTEVTPTQNNLALLLWDTGQPDEAIRMLTLALEGNRQIWGDDHLTVAYNLQTSLRFTWSRINSRTPPNTSKKRFRSKLGNWGKRTQVMRIVVPQSRLASWPGSQRPGHRRV